MSALTPLKCALCGKPTVFSCEACKNAPGALPFETETGYCSDKCRDEHWTAHKEHCGLLKKRKALYRAASILQDAVYMYRRKILEYKPLAVYTDREKGIMILRGLASGGLASVEELGCWSEEIFRDDKEMRSALAYMGCTETVAWFHNLVEYFMSGES